MEKFTCCIKEVFPTPLITPGASLVPSIAMLYVIAGGTSSKRFVALMFGGFVGLVVGITMIGIKPSVAVFPIVFALLGFLVDRNEQSKSV